MPVSVFVLHRHPARVRRPRQVYRLTFVKHKTPPLPDHPATITPPPPAPLSFERIIPRVASSSKTAVSTNHSPSTPTVEHKNQLRDFIYSEVDRDGRRVVLPFLTMADRLRLSECSKELVRYRAHLANIRIIHRASSRSQLEDSLVRLLTRGGLSQPQALDLTAVDLSRVEAATLGSLLAKGAGQALEELCLRVGHDVVPMGLGYITGALSRGTCPLLRKLQLRTSDVALGTKGGELIATVLRSPYCERLEEVDLHGTSLGDEGMGAIARALLAGCCPNLSVLHLSGCDLSSTGAGYLAKALKTGRLPKLEVLGLYANQCLGDIGMVHVTEALKASRRSKLKRLELRHVGMGAMGACALARVFKAGYCPGLQHLDISFNEYMGLPAQGDDAMSQVLTSLAAGSCPDLRYLNMSYAGLDQLSCKALIQGLAEGAWPKLEVLMVAHNQAILERLGGELARALEHGYGAGGLKELSLHNTGISKEGAASLAAALKNGACLRLQKMRVTKVDGVDWKDAVRSRAKQVEVVE